MSDQCHSSAGNDQPGSGLSDGERWNVCRKRNVELGDDLFSCDPTVDVGSRTVPGFTNLILRFGNDNRGGVFPPNVHLQHSFRRNRDERGRHDIWSILLSLFDIRSADLGHQPRPEFRRYALVRTTVRCQNAFSRGFTRDRSRRTEPEPLLINRGGPK